jgi:hypothetical protein
MERNELAFEVPGLGDVLLEPFNYSNGCEGYTYTTKDGKFNLTQNIVDNPWHGHIILKMYDGAETVNNHLLKKTDLFEVVHSIHVGINTCKVVKLNPDYYEKD